MKKHFCFLFLVALNFLVSCQKEVTDPDMQPPTSGTGGQQVDTYMPLTKNTYWRYKDSITSAVTVMTVLDKKKAISGRTYTAVLGSNTAQTDTFYMTQQNRDYYNYVWVNNGGHSAVLVMHYLNDTAVGGHYLGIPGRPGQWFCGVFQNNDR
jgi:hypothetical protein